MPREVTLMMEHLCRPLCPMKRPIDFTNSPKAFLVGNYHSFYKHDPATSPLICISSFQYKICCSHFIQQSSGRQPLLKCENNWLTSVLCVCAHLSITVKRTVCRAVVLTSWYTDQSAGGCWAAKAFSCVAWRYSPSESLSAVLRNNSPSTVDWAHH